MVVEFDYFLSCESSRAFAEWSELEALGEEKAPQILSRTNDFAGSFTYFLPKATRWEHKIIVLITNGES